MTALARRTAPAAVRRGDAPAVLHPLAWWAWAAGAILALTRTSHPVAVVLLTGAVVAVVVWRKSSAPWTRIFTLYLVIAGAVVTLRLAFYVLFGIRTGGQVLVPLPTVPLPDWAGGISLLGPIETAGLLQALYGAMGLAAIIICFGAANALANPRHVLRHLPGALHDLATAVVIAVTVTPQLIASARTVRRARRLRGVGGSGPRALLGYVRPVLQDAMDRAIALAASMDSRGYGRTHGSGSRSLSLVLLVAVLLAGLGTYAVLDATMPAWLGLPVLALAALLGALATARASRRVKRTRYWAAPWRWRESATVTCAAAAAIVVVLTGATAHPDPLQWPGLPLGIVAAACLLLAPALLGRGGR